MESEKKPFEKEGSLHRALFQVPCEVCSVYHVQPKGSKRKVAPMRKLQIGAGSAHYQFRAYASQSMLRGYALQMPNSGLDEGRTPDNNDTPRKSKGDGCFASDSTRDYNYCRNAHVHP